MSDIVDRLRQHVKDWPKIADYYAGDAIDLAIAEIERLRAENDEMKFVIEATSWTPEQLAAYLAECVPVAPTPPTAEGTTT